MTENVLLEYFQNVKKNFAASSMWTKYSMLKITLKVLNYLSIKLNLNF
jgi:hypothetical protein